MELLYKNSTISFTSIGKGNTIVLLHGFLENSTMWNAIAAQLSKKYRVVCIDLLGHGKTGNIGYVHSMEVQAKMVKTVLNYLRLRKYVLVGHSMGGYIALAFAKLYSFNLKGLYLINSSALPDTEEKKTNRDRGIIAVEQNHKMFIKLAIPMLFTEVNRAIFSKEIKTVTEEALKISIQGIIAALEGMKIRKNQTSIYKTATFPIQLIIGKQDPALDYNSLISQTNNTNVVIVEFPDGHMSHIENKNDLILNLEKFARNCFR